MRGGDKLLEPVDGMPLLHAQIDKAAMVSDRVFVTLPAPDHPRAGLIAATQAQPVYVPDAQEGINASLRIGVAALPDCDAFLVLLADLAALTSDDLASVIKARQDYPDALIWRGATQDNRQGHPILFDASLRPDFAQLTGDSGGQSIVSANRKRIHLVPLPRDNARLDLDTPENWVAWRKATGR